MLNGFNLSIYKTAHRRWLRILSITPSERTKGPGVYVLVTQSCLFVTPWTVAHQAPLSWNSPGNNTGVGCHSLLQGIFPTQGSNPGLLPHRQILCCLSYSGNLTTLNEYIIIIWSPLTIFLCFSISHLCD